MEQDTGRTEGRVDNEAPHILVVGDGVLPERIRTVLRGASWARGVVVGSEPASIRPQLVIVTEGDPVGPYGSYADAAFLLVSSAVIGGEMGSIDASDTLREDFADNDLKYKVLSLLSRRGHLLLLLQDLDSSATRLARTGSCEWVRSRIAIVGLTRVQTREHDGPKLRAQIARAVAGAHALLDSLPENVFSVNDAWNLLLAISLPWSEEEAVANTSIYDVLTAAERDLRGSRKLLLWRGTSPSHHLGSFSHDGTSWVPSSPDPLREEVQRVARDAAEAAALGVLFQSRITEKDLEHLLDTLARDEVREEE